MPSWAHPANLVEAAPRLRCLIGARIDLPENCRNPSLIVSMSKCQAIWKPSDVSCFWCFLTKWFHAWIVFTKWNIVIKYNITTNAWIAAAWNIVIKCYNIIYNSCVFAGRVHSSQHHTSSPCCPANSSGRNARTSHSKRPVFPGWLCFALRVDHCIFYQVILHFIAFSWPVNVACGVWPTGNT